MSLFAVARLPREILFGAGQRQSIGKVATRYGARILICTDERLASSGVIDEILDQVQALGAAAHVDASVQPDVPYDSVRECADRVRIFNPDVVIGIGGGSCLDMAKCVGLLLSHGGELRDYYGEFRVPGPTLPMIAVPTTSGTGSEATPVAVISDKSRSLKVGISSPHLIPVVAICDPELTLTCPPTLTAIAGADALTHAIEAFTALRRRGDAQLPHDHVFVGKNALSDHYALLAVRLISKSLERAFTNGSDIDARSDVMLAALAAGCAFGVAGTGAAHAIQYPVGAVTGTAHGLGVATLMPYVMTYNKHNCVGPLVEIADALGVTSTSQSPDARADAAIEGVSRLFSAIGITPTLRDLGLPQDQLGWTAEQAVGIERLIKNNARPIDLAAMNRLVRAAHDGDFASAR